MPPGVRRAPAKLERQRKNRADEDAIRQAAALYREKIAKGVHISIRDHARRMHVDRQRLTKYLHGRRLRSEVDATKSHLGPEESQQLVDWLVAQAERGFPLTDPQIEELANHVIRKLGKVGPEWQGVGKDWVSRFRLRYDDQLARYWSKSLSVARADALSPAHVDHWFDLLMQTILDGAVTPDRIFAMDESGLQISVLLRKMVTGGRTATGAKKTVQHMQSGSNRELVTVIATICADGTAPTPTVVFQGKNLMKNWVEDNPLGAHIGMSAKGYNNSVVGLAWLKIFEEETRSKAPNGEKRILIVDGHGSHYTIEALEFARAHNIEIMAYPPHTTHALQGLDVVLFAPLKRAYSDAVRKLEQQTSEHATKACFLSLFSGPWRETFTPALIQEAFRKTGVWPVDRNVIRPEQLQPAVANSFRPGFGPRTPSPVRAIMKAITAESPTDAAARSAVDPALLNIPITPERSPVSVHRISAHRGHVARSMLRGTSAAFVLGAAVHPDDKLPSPHIRVLEPSSPDWRLGDAVPDESPTSATLRAALRKAQARNASQKRALLAAHTSMALQGVRLNQLSTQIATKSKKKNDIRRVIFKSGHGVVLTSEETTKLVRSAYEKREHAAKERAERKATREAKRKLTAAEKLHKQQVTSQFKADLLDWEAKCAAIKAAHPGKKRYQGLPPRPKNPLYKRKKTTKKRADHSESPSEGPESEDSLDEDDASASSGDDDMDVDLADTDDGDSDWDDVEYL